MRSFGCKTVIKAMKLQYNIVLPFYRTNRNLRFIPILVSVPIYPEANPTIESYNASADIMWHKYRPYRDSTRHRVITYIPR
jgi:hypothetical protein